MGKEVVKFVVSGGELDDDNDNDKKRVGFLERTVAVFYRCLDCSYLVHFVPHFPPDDAWAGPSGARSSKNPRRPRALAEVAMLMTDRSSVQMI